MRIKQNKVWKFIQKGIRWKQDGVWKPDDVSEPDISEPPISEPPVIGYALATDDDFSGTEDGEFKYIGEHEYVIIPNVIKGVNVTSTKSMFGGSGIKIKGVASKNKNITDMSYMFRNATRLSNLDLKYLDTSNVQNMSYMFSYASYLSIDVSNFNTENVTNMNSMFEGSLASADVLDLSSFVINPGTNIKGIFNYNKASEIYVRNEITKDSLSSLTNIKILVR